MDLSGPSSFACHETKNRFFKTNSDPQYRLSLQAENERRVSLLIRENHRSAAPVRGSEVGLATLTFPFYIVRISCGTFEDWCSQGR